MNDGLGALSRGDTPTALVAVALTGAAGYALLRLLAPAPPPPATLTLDGASAISCTGAGGYDVLQPAALGGGATRGAAEAFKGVDEADLVTVRVAAAGVNYADICLRWGLYASWKEYGGGTRPGLDGDGVNGDVPGFEIAGVVETADGAGEFAVGEEVFGVSLFGGYSSRITLPRWQLFRRPTQLSAAQAAGLPCVAMTAWFAVQQQASPIAKGHWVLVHSAAGGVGSMLVQMAKINGWKVLGVVGQGHKVVAVEALGADAVVEKSGLTSEQLWVQCEQIAPEGFAAIFDANGVATLSQSWEHLAPCGKLIVYGFHTMMPRVGGVISPLFWLRIARDWLRTPSFNPLEMTSSNRSALAFNLSFLFSRRDILDEAMAELLGWVAEGQLVMPKVTEFPMADVRKAHAALESGTTVGKLVLIPP